jgi:GxxExxY protein
MDKNEISIDQISFGTVVHTIPIVEEVEAVETDVEPIIERLYDAQIVQVEQMANKVFQALGTGFSEYIYHRAFEVELRHMGISYESKKIIPINYRKINIGYGEADLLVTMDNMIIVVELKAISQVPREIEIAQVHTYMNNDLTIKFGIVINFPQSSTKLARKSIDCLPVYKCAIE